MVERVYRHLTLFDSDRKIVVEDTEMECLPYASFGDFLDENPHVTNVLMNPVYKFYNMLVVVTLVFFFIN